MEWSSGGMRSGLGCKKPCKQGGKVTQVHSSKKCGHVQLCLHHPVNMSSAGSQRGNKNTNQCTHWARWWAGLLSHYVWCQITTVVVIATFIFSITQINQLIPPCLVVCDQNQLCPVTCLQASENPNGVDLHRCIQLQGQYLYFTLPHTFPWSAHGVLMECSWTAHGLLMDCSWTPWSAHGLHVECSRTPCRVFMECSWSAHGVLMELPICVREVMYKFLC